MELSRREFLKGLGAIGLSVLLARKHGAVLPGRGELIAWGKENGVLKPQWQGAGKENLVTEWHEAWHGWERKLRDCLCQLIVSPCTPKERVYKISGVDYACPECESVSSGGFIIPEEYRPFRPITWTARAREVFIPFDSGGTLEDVCRERGSATWLW